MSQKPGADELRIRHLLRRRGVGPDAQPPTEDPDGWWDDLYADEQPKPRRAPRMPDWWKPKPATMPAGDAAEPADEEPAEEPEASPDPDPDPSDTDPEPSVWWMPQPDYWPRPRMPEAVTHSRERAEAAISPRTRRILYNASAAGAGWGLGLYQQFADALADCGTTSIGGALVLGVGGTLLIAHVWDRRTRHWWPGIAWCARIPLATAVLALALWAPAAS